MDQELLRRYITGDATEPERDEVADWLDADENHKKELLVHRKLYYLPLWQEQSVVRKRPISHSNYRRIGLEILKIAAVFAIAFVVGYTFVTQSGPTEVQMQTIYVPAGQRVELTLTDGTKVWLNAKTTFTFPDRFDSDSREVMLDGEGYFDVSKDQKKPFTVKTAQHDIRVLGTEFNVLAYQKSDLFEVSLLKGAVEVNTPGSVAAVRLEPNMQVVCKNGVLVKEKIVHPSYFLWKEGIISFENEPMGSLINKLQLYYDIKIVTHGKDILQKRYTGKFRTKDGIEHVLKVLQLRNKFTYEKDDDLNLITIR